MMYAIEAFLGKWNHLLQVVAIASDIFVACAIYAISRKDSLRSDSGCLEIVITELEEQFRHMYEFNNFFQNSNAINTAIDQQKEEEFLKFLWDLRQTTIEKRVDTSLQKYRLYQPLFDKYRKGKVEVFGMKCAAGDLKVKLDEVVAYLKRAEEIQNEMLKYFRWDEVVRYKKGMLYISRIGAINNHMKEAKSYENFVVYLNGQRIIQTVNWEKARSLWNAMSKDIDKYNNNVGKVLGLIKDNETLSELFGKYRLDNTDKAKTVIS